jgi:ectoine hydroxylase-related dioxygenase (phytanoyl-CoA dioxygenase family)
METVKTAGLVDEELIQRFRRDGFVVVPDLLSDDEVDRYRAAVTSAVSARTDGDDRPLSERSRYEQSFTQCMNLWEDHLDVRELTFHPRVGQAAAELLGIDAIRVWHDQALFKQAGGRSTDPHQDHPYWPMKETAAITAWIPFEAATRESGSLAFLPGSHLIGMRKFVNIFFGEPEDILAEPEVADIEPVYVDVPRGSVSFHHALTVHLADANSTEQQRGVHTIIYFADGNTRGYPYPHFAVDRGGIEMGQPIASEVTPIAWPRPDGDLPATPSSSIDLPMGLIANPGAVPKPQ